MTKTRSRNLNLVVKKEEHENKPKVEQMLHSSNNASKSKSKITKSRKLAQAQNAEVKSENANDSKVLLASPNKAFTRPRITAEQITKLIGYIVNDKMSVKATARKVGMNESTALRYYHEYQDDPEHKIPLPKARLSKPLSMTTQEKIDNLIRYLVNDGMKITQASKKVYMDRNTAAKYYAKYLEDPERKIPLLNVRTGASAKRCTKEEIADLIGYIVRDEMPLVEASKKVNISLLTAKSYYTKYLQNPNHEIPYPRESNQRHGRPCTHDQVSSLIGSIVDDGMTLLEASIKANMGVTTAKKYYRKHLNDPEKKIPTPDTNNNRVSSNPPTADQIKNFFCYIIIDKLNITQAARKAKIPESSGYLYYQKYLKSPNNQIDIKNMSYSNKNKKYTQEDIKRFIDYIERDKMSLWSAARIIKMSQATALRYYKEYQNDPEHKIPVPIIKRQTQKNREHDKFTRIIADIYKNNPSIKPIYQIHDSEVDVPDIKIKKEPVEEDTKTALKTENS